MQSCRSFIVELMRNAAFAGVSFVRKTNGDLTEVESSVAKEFIANKFRTMKRKPWIKAAKKHSYQVNNLPAIGAYLKLRGSHHESRRMSRLRSAL